MPGFARFFRTFCLLVSLVLLALPAHSAQSVPATALLRAVPGIQPGFQRSLRAFAGGLLDPAQPDAVVGVYAPGLFQLPVDQQPEGKASYVTSKPETATQFAQARSHGTVGLLAHNTLAGAEFSGLEEGSTAVVIYGDGRMQTYVITAIERYRALSPRSIFSRFARLDGSGSEGEVLSAAQLFQRMYGQEGRLVFQTCIAKGSSSAWGRVFLIAEPLDSRAPGLDWGSRLADWWRGMTAGAFAQVGRQGLEAE